MILKKENIAKVAFFAIIAFCLFGVIDSATALALGFIFSIIFKNPFLQASKKGIHYLLKIAVVGLGFGMSIKEAIDASVNGIGLVILSIFITVFLGIFLGKLLKVDKHLSFLVTSGTAICGGSAIAAVSPVIKADSKLITIALAIVFTLNSIALLIFPGLGHFFHLTQEQFGLWAATAIHDTSSVVGAALSYGDEALKIATTLKLSRTLWIIPLSLLAMFLFKSKDEKIKIPYFILGFILAIIINSYTLLPNIISENIVLLSKRMLVLTLFLIGTTLSITEIRKIGVKPLFLALSLWIFISTFSLVYILFI